MRMTLSKLKGIYQQGEKITCLTAYDAAFGHWVSQAGIDMILVGDSLGMVVQGNSSTLPVTVDEMVYHTKMVQKGNEHAWCIADMPFMSDSTLALAIATASRLMKEAGANMVKLEGGLRVVPIVKELSHMGIPVCGHLGLLPQSVEKYGYKIQVKDDSEQQLLSEALALQDAGIEMIVFECIPSTLAKSVTEQLAIPVIGIGSGVDTSGQVLVLHDILGITLGKSPKFSKNFLEVSGSIQNAISTYLNDVKLSQFPAACHEVG